MHGRGGCYGFRQLTPHMVPTAAFAKLSWTMSAKGNSKWEQSKGLILSMTMNEAFQCFLT